MASDRLRPSNVTIRKEDIACYLGCWRTTISPLCHPMSEGRCIELSRGEIFILDRERLEAEACGCYSFCRNAFASLQDEQGIPKSAGNLHRLNGAEGTEDQLGQC